MTVLGTGPSDSLHSINSIYKLQGLNIPRTKTAFDRLRSSCVEDDRQQCCRPRVDRVKGTLFSEASL